MARLTTKARKKIPSGEFAGPHRSFPIEDRAHAIAAERLVGRAEKAGSISLAQAVRIKAKARAKLAGK
jgi:hypothetical protein